MPNPAVLDLVADCGADPAGKADCDAAWDAALARCQAAGGGLVAVPPGVYLVSRPVVLDCVNLTIRGAGPGLSRVGIRPPAGLLRDCGYGAPVFLAGVRVRPTGKPFDRAAHVVDVSGRLDATAGKRWGLKPGADMHLSFWAGAAAHGADGYAAAGTLTVALALDPNGKQLAGAYGSVAGLRDGDGPAPWSAGFFQPDVPLIQFRTVEPDGSARTWGYWCLLAPGTDRVRRVVWQVDLDAGTVLAWADGVQVAARTQTPMPPAPGRRLARNETVPFQIGSNSPFTAQRGSVGATTWTLCGLWVGRRPVYADDGAGRPIRRLDGRPVTDASTFFDNGPGLVVFLSLQDDGTGPVDGRAITHVCGGDRDGPDPRGYGDYGWGLWMYSGQPGAYLGGLSIRDLGVVGGYWGQPVCLGPMYGVDLRDLDCSNGWHGIGSVPSGLVAYPVSARDCRLGGYQAQYHGHLQIAHLTGLSGYAGSYAGLFEGSRVVARDWFVYSQPRGDYTFLCLRGGTGGGQYTFEDVEVDNEGQHIPARATWCVENGAFLPQRLTVRGADLGTCGPDAVLVELRDGGPESPSHKAARVRVETVAYQPGQKLRAVVSADGPLWTGVVERPAGLAAGVPDIDWRGQGGPGRANVRVVDPAQAGAVR